MLLLRTSSIFGLQTSLDGLSASNTSNAAAISILNGDATIKGSIAEAQALSKTYADSKVGNIDLSQVAANKTAIATLNGDDKVVGSVAKAQSDIEAADVVKIDAEKASFVSTELSAVQGRLDILEGDATVDGSLEHAVAGIMGGTVPAELDTLKEIGDRLLTEEGSLAALVSTVASNKTANDTAIAQLNTDIGTQKDAIIADNVTKMDTVDAKVQAGIKSVLTQANADYFNVTDAFADTTDAQKATIISQLDAITKAELPTLMGDYSPLYKREMVAVTAGEITLDYRVSPAHVTGIEIVYPDGSYDDLLVVAGSAAGKFTVNTGTAGDLDGTSVQVEYVIDRTL